MNRILGVATPDGAEQRCHTAVEWLASRGHSGARLSGRGGPVYIASIDNGGAVLGRAGVQDTDLVYLGWINSPAPGFGAGSPLDNPNVTALYLLHRFHEHGLRFLDGVTGSYILALSLPDSRRLLLARDPSGSRRVFCADVSGGIVFSSYLVDMRGLVAEELKVDRSLEDFHLGYEFLPWERTVFEGVCGLEAGTLLEWKDGECYYHPISSPPPLSGELDLLNESAVVDQLGSVFLSAIQDQVPSSDRVAVMLGGFDSALVASALVQLGKTVETFSFQYEDPDYNQAYTEHLASFLGIRHNWVPIHAEGLRRGLVDFADCFNQPVSQAHYLLNTAETCRAIRNRGFLYCLTGDGCDGLFLGYPTVHQRAKLIAGLSRMSMLFRPLEAIARVAWLERKLGHPYRLFRNVLRILRREMPARGHISSCILDEYSVGLLRTEAPPEQESESEAIILELADKVGEVRGLRLAYLGKAAPGLNRNKLEGNSALSGVVLNSPYMHPGMAALAQSLPDDLSRPDRHTEAQVTGKYALMKMAEKQEYLPPEIVRQKKMSPVTAPVDVWYRGELREFMLAQLSGLPFGYDLDYAGSLLDEKAAEDLFRRKVGISRYTSNAISLLVTCAGFTRLAAK